MTLSHHAAVQPVASIGVTGAVVIVSLCGSYLFRLYRSRWHQVEEDQYGHETLHSIIEHFRDMILDTSTTVSDANQRRTVSYYLKARQAHKQNLVLGVPSYKQLLALRQSEMAKNLKYHLQGDQSHRTVVVMCDAATRIILEEARSRILQSLQYSHDIQSRGVWIPELNMIPPKDMHVTVAIPWWWHTMRDGNADLSQALANRLKQTLVLDFHHPFQIELERFILLGGKTVVALWRTIGPRTNEDGIVIYDRHGDTIDPMVRLRRGIVECFTTENEEIGRKPLTYHTQHKQQPATSTTSTSTTTTSTSTGLQRKEQFEPVPANKSSNKKMHHKSQSMPILPIPIPKPSALKKEDRQHTIEMKTPGMGQGDGFIHTTLCRLPLDCFSLADVELEPIHRLCREATATYCGHRMVVSKFRFLETTGIGGESNPCVDPIFDETMEAPSRLLHSETGQVTATDNMHLPRGDQERNATIGALPEFPTRNSMDGLFDGDINGNGDDIESITATK
jgi:hypothetical protein